MDSSNTILIDDKYEMFNKVVNLGIDITKPMLMPFSQFAQKYEDVDLKFKEYLVFLKDSLQDKSEWQWYKDFLNYIKISD